MSFDQAKSAIGKQRLVEVSPDEMWTDFLEQVNELMLEEKAARQVSDHIKLAEICVRIVSSSLPFLTLNEFSSNFHLTTKNTQRCETSCCSSSKEEVRQRSL